MRLARLQGRAYFKSAALRLFLLLPLCAGLTTAQPQQKDTSDILAHLNAAISWYRRIAGLDVTAGQPSDTLYLENARSSASQALQLAFQASEAQAALLSQGNTHGPGSPSTATAGGQPTDQQTNIAKAIASANSRISQAQTQLDDLNKRLASVHGKQRQQLLSQRDALQGQLDLDNMILDALQKISSVSTGNDNGASGFAGQINQLKQSVPEVFAPASSKKGTSTPSAPSIASRADSVGLIGQTSILFTQMRDMHDIDQLMAQTVRLRDTANQLASPLRDSLRTLIRQGRDTVNQTPSSDPAEIAATRKKFETLTAQFKQISAAAVPLRQEIILLDECDGDLLQWRNSIAAEYGRVLRTLLLRVAGILVALVVLFLLSELWRRATYRYVHDTRRRRQLLLVRRFATGFLMAVVIVMGFLSEFSSLATFAGFITAGIAVALQTVILSVAAYFFLIGRYGVRVGDRLTVSGVTGDVIEIGLVRLYLMELSGTGVELYPTGRVVVFSNSVMFQAAPFFKQLPGTAYAWHEIALTLSPEANPAAVEQQLHEAVDSVYSEYRHSIDHQHSLVERLVDAPMAAPALKTQLRFTDDGLELSVRYPVEISHAAEVDEKVTRKLMEVIGRNQELKAAVTGTPKLRAAIKA